MGEDKTLELQNEQKLDNFIALCNKYDSVPSNLIFDLIKNFGVDESENLLETYICLNSDFRPYPGDYDDLNTLKEILDIYTKIKYITLFRAIYNNFPKGDIIKIYDFYRLLEPRYIIYCGVHKDSMANAEQIYKYATCLLNRKI